MEIKKFTEKKDPQIQKAFNLAFRFILSLRLFSLPIQSQKESRTQEIWALLFPAKGERVRNSEDAERIALAKCCGRTQYSVQRRATIGLREPLGAGRKTGSPAPSSGPSCLFLPPAWASRMAPGMLMLLAGGGRGAPGLRLCWTRTLRGAAAALPCPGGPVIGRSTSRSGCWRPPGGGISGVRGALQVCGAPGLEARGARGVGEGTGMTTHPPFYLFNYAYVYLLMHLVTHASVCLCIYLLMHLFVHLLMYSFTYAFT